MLTSRTLYDNIIQLVQDNIAFQLQLILFIGHTLILINTLYYRYLLNSMIIFPARHIVTLQQIGMKQYVIQNVLGIE